MVFKDVTSCWVLKVATGIGGLSSFVYVVALTILQHLDIASVISIELAQYIMDVKCSMFRVRWHLHRMTWLVEVLKHVLGHEDLSFV